MKTIQVQYFAMLREKLHWSETPERLSRHGHDSAGPHGGPDDAH